MGIYYWIIYILKNMIIRRQLCEDNLPSHIKLLTLTTFPRMGCNIFTSPPSKPNGIASQSLFLPDDIINRHARFPTLTANIRKERDIKWQLIYQFILINPLNF